tara:strand:- start:101 stop:493 length:393 start_codon:yes stop_codon:yes gene_type:complete
MQYNLWVYIAKAEDIDGVWNAHCLDLDIVAFGDTPAQARDNVRQAVETAILDDLNQGLSPLDCPKAPAEYYEELFELQRVGKPANIAGKPGAFSRFAVQVSCSFELVNKQPEVNVSFPQGCWPSWAADAA